MAGPPWTMTEDARLRELYTDATMSITRIAILLRRPRGAVIKHASDLGIRRPADAPRIEDEP